MIDPKTGQVHFDRPAMDIAPSLTRSGFLKSELAKGTKTFMENEPGHSWKLAETYVAQLPFLVILYFHQERLGSITLYANPVLDTSWADWSEEKELQRKALHDQWLDRCLGSRRDFPWGSVGSEYDPRSGSSTITIRYI